MSQSVDWAAAFQLILLTTAAAMAVPVIADLKLSKLLTEIIKRGMNWDGRM